MTPYERFRPAFAELLDPRKWPLEWLDGEIETGTATVFGNDRACIVVALRKYPGGLIEVHGLCAAGDMAEIISLIEQAEAWGARHGATLGTIASRRGWVKTMASRGYRESQVTIEKELTHGA